jgi:tetratricopeptide (TPR) repeat protein
MAKGEYKLALKELEEVDVSDTYVSVMALGLQGDCRSELKEYDKAATLYVEAADKSDNEMTTPMYLMKAGLCAEEVKDFENATKYYERIRDDYTAYASQKAIDKYIARAKNKIIKKK